MSFSISLDGIDQMERDFRRIEHEVSDGARRAVERGTREGVDAVKASHRYTDRTGALTSTAYGRVEVSTPGGAFGVMVWPVKYASFVDAGTRPHLIVGNPFLSFEWKGVRVFLRYVNHPGTKSFAFAGEAYLKCERVMFRELEIAAFRGQEILAAA